MAYLDDGAAFSKLMLSLGDSNMKAQGEGVSPKFQTQIGQAEEALSPVASSIQLFQLIG